MTYEQMLSNVLAEITGVLANVDPKSLELASANIFNSRRIVCAGAGRMGLMMKAFAMRLGHLNLPATFLGDSTVPRLDSPNDLLIIGTGSGVTPSMRLLAQIAHDAGVKVMCITADVNSPIAQLSDLVIELHATAGFDTPNSIQPMKTYVEQSLLILLDVLSLMLMNYDGVTSDDLYRRHSTLE